ncbi:MAG: malectin domain-containing carbohydrate-binding protein [Terriglobia bacterium]
MATPLPYAREKAELDRVLGSEVFAKSPTSSKLLQFICKKFFEDKAPDLKEYTIGVEALGRASGFDPTTSSIVRVEIHRVREKLKKYYEGEGADHPIRIYLQAGNYSPQFLPRGEPANGSVAGPEAWRPGEAAGIPSETLTVEAENPSQAALGEAARMDAPEQTPTARKPLGRILALGVAGIAVVLGLTLWTIWKGRTSASASLAPASRHVTLPPPLQTESEVRILAGYSRDRYIDRAGRTWRTDRYFNGGTVLEGPRDFIPRTSDPMVFRSARTGDFSYDIPLKPGVYELHLFFAEPKFGPATYAGGGESSRIFSVEANGQPILTDCDVVSQAGGSSIALQRTFKDVTPAADGYLHLKFLRYEDQPLVNALEILPVTPGKMRPVRIVAQDTSFTDSAGRIWSPDTYFSGGRLTRRKGSVADTEEHDLYGGERYGRFDYSVPVAAGRYSLTLYFSETYFGTANSGFGGVGSRVFDVYCNGVHLLKNFDIFKEAGGASRALTRSFHGLEPNAAGQLLVSFVPVRNYACLNALEVVDESE